MLINLSNRPIEHFQPPAQKDKAEMSGLRYTWSLMCVFRVGQAAEKLEDAALDVQRVATVVEATSKTMSSRDPLRRYMDLIYAQVSLP